MLQPSDLHVVAVHSNPMMFASRPRLATKFIRRMEQSGCTLWVVEARMGQRQFEITDAADPRHIQLRCDDAIWIKEAMMQVAFARLPADAKYVAFVDADIGFTNESWVMDTLNVLQHVPVAQMWSTAADFDARGDVMQTHKSFAFLYGQGERPTQVLKSQNYESMHPGYAWAWRVDTLNAIGGLLRTGILGAGDTHMALGIIGRGRDSVNAEAHPGYIASVVRWGDRARAVTNRNLGHVPGMITHEYHGQKADRRYHDRWQIILKHQFNPDADLVWDRHGMPFLAGNKPDLRDDITRYFQVRREDAGEGRHHVV